MARTTELKYKVKDGKKKEAFISLYAFNNSFTADWLSEVARASLPIIRNVLTGGMSEVFISFEAEFGDLFASFPSLAAPDPDSDVEEGAFTNWAPLDGWDDYTEIKIPTFDEDLILPGTKQIDYSDPRFVALIGLITEDFEPTVGRALHYCAHRSDQLIYFVNGEEVFTRREKRRRKRY